MRYFAFDLLFLGGLDLRPLPLIERKEALRAIITAPGIVRFSEHFQEDGPTFLRHACLLGVEGVVSKRSDAPYRSGRTKQWVKVKCFQRQEFIICGYVPSTIAAKGVGSLVLGYYDNGKLIHAGRVGTGFSNKLASDITGALKRSGSRRAHSRASSPGSMPETCASSSRSLCVKWSFARGAAIA
jgi:bifunctional non-homologous end joining protein LigD